MERSESALRVLLFWFDAFRGHHGHHVVFFCFVFGDVLVWVSSLGHGIEKNASSRVACQGSACPPTKSKKKMAQNASDIRVM